MSDFFGDHPHGTWLRLSKAYRRETLKIAGRGFRPDEVARMKEREQDKRIERQAASDEASNGVIHEDW